LAATSILVEQLRRIATVMLQLGYSHSRSRAPSPTHLR